MNVVIGRFQPFTEGHRHLINEAKKDGPVTVVIGSVNEHRSYRNPFTYKERKDFINAEFDGLVRIVGLQDSHYDFDDWKRNLIGCTVGKTSDKSVTLYGNVRDASSYYLKKLGWKFVPISDTGINATNVRDLLFNSDVSFENVAELSKVIPENTLRLLSVWFDSHHKETVYILEERRAILEYKEKWAKAPYPPVFVTADSLVTNGNKILLIRRKKAPGKQCFAMPGGHLEANETIFECSIRETFEETGVDLSKCVKDAPVVFDSPWRDPRGRYVTHVFRYEMYGPLAPVNGLDDAEYAGWFDIADLNPSDFYADHYHILKKLLGGYI
jgi:bifunctional NMN adenylyltransferase/nudix hydrolase